MTKNFGSHAVCLAVAGMFVFASLAGAAEKPLVVPVAVDVALAEGGLLRGQVLDAQGAPLKNSPVSIWHENHQVAATVSDGQGQFSVMGLRGGVHRVVAGEQQAVYRLWTAEAAPPAARPGTVVIGGTSVIRGQNGQMVQGPHTGLPRGLINSPVLWGGLAYAAGHVIGFNSGIDRVPSSP